MKVRHPGARRGASEGPEDVQQLADAQENSLALRRWQRQIESIHACGPRTLAELVTELGAELLIRSEIEAKVGRCTEIDPSVVRLPSADSFSPPPIRLVPP